MEAVRLTFHKGYRNAKGRPYNVKHNDRDGFEKPKSAENNVYRNYAALTWGGETFLDGEMACYEACFRPHIKAQNDKNKKARHPERNVSLKQYYEKHPPEETLMYLGNKDNNVGSEVLLEVFHEYRDWLNSTCVDNEKGCGVELLNAALHMDEATPHMHFRQMYYYTDKYGDFEISQNKALEGLGYGKGVKAKKDFTAVSREKMKEIARSHGVELIEKPLPEDEVGRTLEEYIVHEQMKAEQAAMEQDFQKREEAICAETENAKQVIQAERAAMEQDFQLREEDLERRERSLAVDEKDREDYYAFVEDKREREAAEAAERRREQMSHGKEESHARYAAILERVQKAPETPETVSEYPNTPETQTPLKNDLRGQYDGGDDSNVEIICVEDDDPNDDWDFGL